MQNVSQNTKFWSEAAGRAEEKPDPHGGEKAISVCPVLWRDEGILGQILGNAGRGACQIREA